MWAAAAVLALTRAAAGEPLTVDDAIRAALRGNPSLAAAAGEVEAAKAALRGARALSNPALTVTPSVAGKAGSDEELSIEQPLEISGARSARATVALGEASAAAAERHALEREVIRDIRIAYWEAARAQAVVRLDTENVKLLESLLAASKRQVEVGSAPGSHTIKAEVELARARQDQARTQAELEQAKAVLNTLMGRDPATSFTVADPLTPRKAAPDEAGGPERRPEMARAKSLLAARRGEIAAARALTRPDLSVQVRKDTFEGDGGIGIGLTLPVFDWGSSRAARRQAEAAAAAQEQRILATRGQLELDLERALAAARSADAQVREYETGVVEKSEQLALMAEKGYRTGATGYLEVLEAQRTLQTVKVGYYDALADQAKADARLEWAAGDATLDTDGGQQ